MSRSIFTLSFMMTFAVAFAQNTFQLAPPYLHFESVFFKKECRVAMVFAEKNTLIRYTTDGLDPTEKSPVYTRPIVLKNKHNVLKARVFGEGFIPSDVVETSFYKAGMPIESITCTPPNKQYPGSGPATLMDNLGGQSNFRSKTWMGFDADTVNIELGLAKPKMVRQVMFHLFENNGAWIYLPHKVEVYAYRKGADQPELIAQKIIESAVLNGQSECRALTLDMQKPLKTSRLLLKVYPLMKIPQGHPGEGNKAWIFIDEINLY